MNNFRQFMIKAVLFDADGLVVLGKYKYFSDRFSEEHGVPNDKIMDFFRNEYKLCAVGKMDLKTAVEKYFPSWNWKESAEDFLNYWFSGENEVNEKILKLISELQQQGIKCYLATNQEKYRTKFLWEDLDLNKIFDGIFVSCEIGFTKKDNEYYRKIKDQLTKINSNEILMIDGDETVLQKAIESGITTLNFEGIREIEEEINKRIFTESGKKIYQELTLK